MDDRQAIDRYRYLLRTAPAEDIERAHAEAFERLTPEQRQAVLSQLASQVPESEVIGADPASLARMATRAEIRSPGTMERTFAGVSGPGMGGMFLATLAGAFVGTSIAGAFMDDAPSADEGASDADADVASEAAGADFGGDGGGDLGDFGGGDFGGF